MSLLTTLTKLVQKGLRRRGRGYGSTRGSHTTGRGSKGDKARGATRLTLDGQKIKKSWIQRTPRLRGKSRLKALPQKPTTITLNQLDKWFKSGQTIDSKVLSQKTGKTSAFFKVLNQGEIKKSLNLKEVFVSESAAVKITAAGGKIVA